MELTQPQRGGGGGGLRPCRATVPTHRVCRVTRGRRYVVLCEGDRHLCHLCRLCRLCHHDTEGGGTIGNCAAARAVTWVSSNNMDCLLAFLGREICSDL